MGLRTRGIALLLAWVAGVVCDGGVSAARTFPEYVLTEEHHHIVPHLVSLVEEGRLAAGGVLVHFDSHHDGGLPSSLGDDLTHDGLLAHTHINNFLLALAWKGVVEHVVFVEPPWSTQCGHLHNVTVVLQIGLAVDGGAPRVAFDDGIGDGAAAMTRLFLDADQVVESASSLYDVAAARFSVVALEDAARVVPAMVAENNGGLVLDVDLDAFGTTSPGALTLRAAIPDVRDLRRLYRLAHDLCVFDGAYDFGVAPPADCARESTTLDDARPRLEALRGDVLLAAVVREFEALGFGLDVGGPRLEKIAEILFSHAAGLRALEARLGHVARKVAAFLGQPYNTEPSAVDGAIDAFAAVAAALPRRPDAVTLVRSPFYAPAETLGTVECHASDALVDLYGRGGVLRVQRGVDANRAHCGARHPATENRDAGPFRFADPRKLHEANVDDLFTFADDEDDDEYEDDSVVVDFANDLDVGVALYWRDTPLATLAPGESTSMLTENGAPWTFRSPGGDAVHLALTVDRKRGEVQRYSSVSGFEPSEHHSPVVLSVVAPRAPNRDGDDAKGDLRLHMNAGDGEALYDHLAYGQRLSIDTFHGHVWHLYDGGERIAMLTVDAANGHEQTMDAEL